MILFCYPAEEAQIKRFGHLALNLPLAQSNILAAALQSLLADP
jgi:hypothetical protein